MANEVVVKVRADTRKAQRSLNDLKGSGDKLNAGLKRAMKGGAIALAGLATAAAASAIKMAIEFEAAMSEVRTLLPQASDEAFGALTADLTAFMKEMNVASSDAVPALYSALSAGVPQDNVIDFLRVASQAATGGVTDLETAVDGLSTVVNVYGADTIDATRASDLMFTAVRLGKTTFGELSATLSNVLPTAQAFGVSVEEVAAALATMTAKGVPTAQSTTQLRALFVETNKESRKLAQAIVELTGKSFRDLMTEGRSAAGVLQELRESVGEKEFSQLFRSVESMNAALLMTGPNAEKMTENLTAMQEAAGATETAFQVVADTTKFQLGQAWNELKVTLMDLGMKALPFIVDALDILKVVVANVSRVVKSDILPALRSFWAVLKDTGYLRFVITQFKNWWTQMKVTWGILKDFLRFVKAVFKGDWKAAWDAVKDIFRGFVNLIITQANRLINVLNAVAGIFKAISGALGKEIDLTVSAIGLWTGANDDLAASAASVETSLDSVVSAGYAVRGSIAVASESIADATGKTDDFSASASQAKSRLGGFTAQLLAAAYAAQIYRAETSGSAEAMMTAALSLQPMIARLKEAMASNNRITEISNWLMENAAGTYSEAEEEIVRYGGAVRTVTTDLDGLTDGLGDAVDGLDDVTNGFDSALGAIERFDFALVALSQAEDVASEVTRRFAIQDIGKLIQQLDGPMQKSWNMLFTRMLQSGAGANQLQEFLGHLEIAISALPAALEEVVPDFDKTTAAIKIMGESADGTVMSLIQLEKHLKQQGGGGGAPTADISTWSMEDRARHMSALAAGGALGGGRGLSINMQDFAQSIGMDFAPSFATGGMMGDFAEADMARRIIRGGVESGATPEQIAALVTETMRRVAEGEQIFGQLGGTGVAGTNVTINIDGIVTDPAATGEQIIEALNAALLLNGESLLTDAVIT